MREGVVAALSHARLGGSIAEVEKALAEGSAQLWWGQHAGMVTQLIERPDGLTAHVWLGFGRFGELMRISVGAEAWARGRGCKWITLKGRRGWTRALKANGFQRHGNELRKAL